MNFSLVFHVIDLGDGLTDTLEELMRIWNSKILRTGQLRGRLCNDLSEVRAAITGMVTNTALYVPPRSFFEGMPTHLFMVVDTVYFEGELLNSNELPEKADLPEAVVRLYDAGILNLTTTEEIVLVSRLRKRRAQYCSNC